MHKISMALRRGSMTSCYKIRRLRIDAMYWFSKSVTFERIAMNLVIRGKFI